MKSADIPKQSLKRFAIFRFSPRLPFNNSLNLDSDMPSILAASLCLILLSSICLFISSVIRVETFPGKGW